MKDYIKNLNLKTQLILVSLIAILFSFITLAVVLPNLLTPFYEKNIYEILKQPLPFIKPGEISTNENTAFLIYDSSNTLLVSDNFYNIIKVKDASLIINKINSNYGKIKISNRTYYYHTIDYKNSNAIAITNDSYIQIQKASLNSVIIPIIVFATAVTILILVIYSNYIVRKITKIKNKIDNLDNNNYNHSQEFDINDELNSLLKSIEKARVSLAEKEEYKSNMFQNISHELKTPIMVITSHVEAANDKVIENDKALEVIKNEANSLLEKVSLIMQMNKLNYLKSNGTYKNEKVDIKPIIENNVNKFKIVRPDVSFDFKIEDSTIFRGTSDNFEIIINNILSNFIRFADKKISVTIKNKSIIFYNDGEPISKDLISSIFEPYKTGNKGHHGLGLAITKQTLNLFNYNIKAENNKNGVIFEIY